jgi:twitching motility two-component system response regulator PilH
MAKILIVDDSPTELHALTHILEREGYQTLTARDGEEGIEVARLELPDLILMDVVMPGLNGFQATRRLTRDEKTRQIPVIIISTKGLATDREWGMRQGAFSYLVKPIEAGNLLDQVRLALTLHVE